MVEIDVRLTSDDIPVVIHDATTLRTHGARITIAKYTYEELVSMDLAPSIPLLEDVLKKFFGKTLLNIELKSKGSAEPVMKLLKQFARTQPEWHNVLISSFRTRELVAARRISKRVPLALLHDQNPFLFIAYHRRLHLTAAGFHRLYIYRLAIAVAKKLDLFCYAYTVDRPHAAILLERQGLDGIVTNQPEKMIAELEK